MSYVHEHHARPPNPSPHVSPSATWRAAPQIPPAHENGTMTRSTSLLRTAPGRTTDSDIYRVGIYGWRKRCLYFFIVVLTIIIFINLMMTIWIMRVLDFHTNGMGNLRITRDGMRVDGPSEFYHPVYFRKIQSLPNSPIEIHSDRAIAMNARNASGAITSRMIIGDNNVQVVCDRFEVFDNDETLLFSTNKDEVTVKVDNLRIRGEGGSRFEGSVQTEVLRPEPGSPLRLESPTHSLKVEALQDIEIMSRAGDLVASARLDISLESQKGEIRFAAKDIYFEALPQTDAQGDAQHQVCVCKNGRLFLARHGTDCRASRDICKK